MHRNANTNARLWLTLLCAASLTACAGSPTTAICPAPLVIPASLLTPPTATDYSLNAQSDIQRWRAMRQASRTALAASSPSSSPNP